MDAGTLHAVKCDDFHCGWEIYSTTLRPRRPDQRGRGNPELTGTNTYAGPTLVNQGRLVVNGSVTSAVSVQNGGIVGGSGTVGSADRPSGRVPWRGQLDRHPERGGQRQLRAGFALRSGSGAERPERSDPEQRLGDDRRRRGGGDAGEQRQPADAKRGTQPAGPAVHHPERAAGVSGQFDAVAPNYLFLGTGLSYQPTGVTLSVGRNGTSFASVAQTPNERAVAAAADAGGGQPGVREPAGSGTAGDARQGVPSAVGANPCGYRVGAGERQPLPA